MKTIILCGGLGTRIRDVSETIPKPMLNIGHRPVLWHIMKIYAHYGHTDFILALGYKSWNIKEFFLNYEVMLADFTLSLGQPGQIDFLKRRQDNWNITFAETGLNTLTGGRVKRAAEYVNDDLFMVTYGDGVGNIDIKALVDFHRSHGGLATVTGVQPPGRFGALRVEGSRVTTFSEKPEAGGGLINGGFCVFSKEVLKLIPNEPLTSLEAHTLTLLAEMGQLHMFPHSGFWQPMDTYREWVQLNALWDEGRAPWKTWTDE